MADEQRRGMFGGLGERLAGGLVAGPVGLLMGPQAFQGMRDARERRAQENMLMRDSIAAREEFTDLLGRQVEVPRYAQGMQFPQITPENDQQIGMPAMNLPGRRMGTQQVPAISTPEGQQRVLQLMSRMSPEGAMKVGESLIPGLSQRTSAIIGDMDALGLPRTMENYERIAATKGGSSNPIEMALAAALLQQREQATRAAAEEQQQQRQDRTRAENVFVTQLEQSGDALMELYDLNKTLSSREGVASILTKPGLPYGEVRRNLAASFGDEYAGMVDQFKTLGSNIALGRLQTEQFDGGSDTRFQAFIETKPAFELLGPANETAVIKNIQGILYADAAAGYQLPAEKRKKYEDFLATVKRGSNGSQQTRSVTLPNGDVMHNVPMNVSDEQLIQWMRER